MEDPGTKDPKDPKEPSDKQEKPEVPVPDQVTSAPEPTPVSTPEPTQAATEPPAPKATRDDSYCDTEHKPKEESWWRWNFPRNLPPFLNLTTAITLTGSYGLYSLATKIALTGNVDPTVASIIGGALTIGGLSKSFRPLEPNMYGEPRLRGWRGSGWMTVKNGSCLWPGKVEQFSVAQQSTKGRATFFSGKEEDLKLSIPWHLTFRVDYKVRENGKVKFLGLDQAKLVDDISQFIASKIDKIGGGGTRSDFKERLKDMEDYLRCVMQLKIPPHIVARWKGNPLDWYRDDWENTQQLLKDEKGCPNERSEFENQFGIDAIAFRLEDPEYTEKTEKDLETKTQQKSRADAAISQVELTEKFIKLGVEPGAALHAAQHAILQTPMNNVAVDTSGNGNAMPILNFTLGGQRNEGSGQKSKGKGGDKQ